MSITDDFTEILHYAHYWNWLPDWDIVEKVYQAFPDSYSVLTPFAYAYLEEMIRSTTSEYGIDKLDDSGKKTKRKVGIGLIDLAIKENRKNPDYITLLENIKRYFIYSEPTDDGDNRNSVAHGYMHSGFWKKESFEKLICDIAILSKYSRF